MHTLPVARPFSQPFVAIRWLLLDMAAHAEEQVHGAMAALRQRDREGATAVILEDRALDAMELRVDEACLTLLARRHPVGADLRLVVGALRIARELERVGDHAVGIAHAARDLAGEPLPELALLEEMAALAGAMLTAVLDHMVRSDAERASLLCRSDEQVDQLLGRFTRDLVGGMTEKPGDVPAGMALLKVGRNLERIADHATNIAECVVYMVEGRRFRRSREAEGSAGLAGALSEPLSYTRPG